MQIDNTHITHTHSYTPFVSSRKKTHFVTNIISQKNKYKSIFCLYQSMSWHEMESSWETLNGSSVVPWMVMECLEMSCSMNTAVVAQAQAL